MRFGDDCEEDDLAEVTRILFQNYYQDQRESERVAKEGLRIKQVTTTRELDSVECEYGDVLLKIDQEADFD
ncbi:MAG TPA: hypothetical protein DEP72_07620 [Clostridiales bacterium]|nr:MAG: hypothetical protein A2Y18_07015 [Clostridiales bacterium GWD2_32_19]HCC08004.1 hypothetical protein [Clostridiales bacterium]